MGPTPLPGLSDPSQFGGTPGGGLDPDALKRLQQYALMRQGGALPQQLTGGPPMMSPQVVGPAGAPQPQAPIPPEIAAAALTGSSTSSQGGGYTAPAGGGNVTVNARPPLPPVNDLYGSTPSAPPPLPPVKPAPIARAQARAARAQVAPPANPNFTQIAAPNQTNLPMSALGRGGPSRQMISALDLSKLFGGS
jgi:hypothetical protein